MVRLPPASVSFKGQGRSFRPRPSPHASCPSLRGRAGPLCDLSAACPARGLAVVCDTITTPRRPDAGPLPGKPPMFTPKPSAPAEAGSSDAATAQAAALDASAATRDRILEAAVVTLESAGEAGVKIREVAALAGAAPTSIYYFFRSREGLLEEALVEAYRRSLFTPFSFLSERIARCGGRDDLKQIFRELLAFNSQPDGVLRRRHRTAILGSAQMRPGLHRRIAEVHRKHNIAFANLYREVQAKGWLRKDLDLTAAMGWFIGLMSSRVMPEMEPGNDAQLREWDRLTHDAIFALTFGEVPSVKFEGD